jgi:aquaporin Z
MDEEAHTARQPALGRRLLVEFIGAFFLVLTVCLATHPGTGAGALAPLAIGGALGVMVFAGGHISGGHYNPAVSTAVFVRGRLGGRDFAGYLVAQLFAAALAGLLARALLGSAPHPVAVSTTWKLAAIELLFTFALAYVVLNVATSDATDGNSFYGLAIGGTVAVGALAAGGISGGAFNPAVALGASIFGTFAWSHLWAYILAELLGGSLAAGSFIYLERPEPPASR